MKIPIRLNNRKPKVIDYLFKHDKVKYHEILLDDIYDPTSFLDNIAYRYEFDRVPARIELKENHTYSVYALYNNQEELLGDFYDLYRDISDTNQRHWIFIVGGKAWKFEEDEETYDIKIKGTFYAPYDVYLT